MARTVSFGEKIFVRREEEAVLVVSDQLIEGHSLY